MFIVSFPGYLGISFTLCGLWPMVKVSRVAVGHNRADSLSKDQTEKLIVF